MDCQAAAKGQGNRGTIQDVTHGCLPTPFRNSVEGELQTFYKEVSGDAADLENQVVKEESIVKVGAREYH